MSAWCCAPNGAARNYKSDVKLQQLGAAYQSESNREAGLSRFSKIAKSTAQTLNKDAILEMFSNANLASQPLAGKRGWCPITADESLLFERMHKPASNTAAIYQIVDIFRPSCFLRQ